MAIRVIFFCGDKSRYGCAHLEPILAEFDVVAVIMGTEERWSVFRETLEGRSYFPTAPLVKYKKGIKRFLSKVMFFRKPSFIESTLSKRKIPLLKIYNVNDDIFIEQLKKYNLDIILSAAYPQIFSKKLISCAKKGAINFHPSLLPRFRGAHPHFWAIAKGEQVGGITAHLMTENIDDGDIVAQISFPIGRYYYSEHYNKIEKETPQLVKLVRAFLEDSAKKPIPQDPKNVSYFRNDREIHRRIFWNIMSGKEIYNLIRTESAHCFFRNKKISIKRADITETNRNLTNNIKVEAGTVIDVTDTSVVVKTNDICLEIKVLFEGHKIVPSYKWAIKNKVVVGEKLN